MAKRRKRSLNGTAMCSTPIGPKLARTLAAEYARQFLAGQGVSVGASAIEGKFASAFIRARKPLAIGSAS